MKHPEACRARKAARRSAMVDGMASSCQTRNKQEMKLELCNFGPQRHAHAPLFFHAPDTPSGVIKLRQIEAQIKLILMIIRLHISAQLIERLVVLFLFTMCQLVDGDHAQKFNRYFFE